MTRPSKPSARDQGAGRPRLRRRSAPFTVLGVDPTAGDWSSGMTRGARKAMPAVVLEWTGRAFRLADCAEHVENASLWQQAQRAGARTVAIDGPCTTAGLRVRAAWDGWDLSAGGGVRDAERELCARRIKLYWTTAATVRNFDGASRWIARSLRLFSDEAGAGFERIETHPHGAFLLLAAASGAEVPPRVGRLPPKTKPAGRAARLELLRRAIPDVRDADLRDHDAVDATCAALVAGLHQLGLTTPHGTVEGGGLIWLPDAEQLRGFGGAAPLAG